MLTPYNYNYIKEQISYLINTYKSVQDIKTVTTIQQTTLVKIEPLLGYKVETIKSELMDKSLTNARAEKIYAFIKSNVIPFNQPSNKQIQKLFRKVKKMPVPDWEKLDLRDYTYLGWDDPGTQRKYIILQDVEQRLQGIYGVMDSQVIKGACSICHQIGNVSLFLSTVNSAGDGTYTKKGNYICKDSHLCNLQIQSPEHLQFFYDTISK
ncbi:FusB/FusC family EF-G-binding protein [Vagococcus vulneris]|uniref:Elongation factor G-binding protein n=1 Tax=Vagococcus vulneris TaxID=1977869 RepID=A0A429ZPR8_9ENTE|nr:FusB/FusC family EF-G-binding protein [Vagococcus vulneris]RST95697.1 hypothetical protein CBF37_11385 [Vagococcus vulneris]